MFSLNPGSLCDVCAEEYGSHNYPHSIPCGHILCLNCCNNILEKTSPRMTPSCPFCRVPFTSDTIRLIRVDFGGHGSGWSTPRATDAPEGHILGAGDDDVLLFMGDKDRDKTRVQLESKVARVAGKKCSVEEVKHLHQELRNWLSTDKKRDEQTAALELSSALLHAILVNHVAHKHAGEMAKQVENNLRDKLREVHNEKEELEQELHRMRTQAAARSAEIQTLRAEMNRHKIKTAAPTLGVPTTPPAASLASAQSGLTSPPRPSSTTAYMTSRSRATSPTSPTPSSARAAYTPATASPLTRISSASAAMHGHTRSASAIPMHRSMTPAARPASAIPAPASAQPIPHLSAKSRLSSPPPALKMSRSTSSSSDEKEKEKQRHAQRVQLMERWIPSMDPASSSPPTGPPTKWPHHQASQSHASFVPPPRFKTPFSVHSP
ncbi:uncharacterized protein C8Q71DRAFT_728463 [Rhodofomes roseus]|uniref:RING-type domain-containing protein n=1 Tax=Rhodofomes roseus TaxID=34475 RepID=A0ABQ8JXG7_9APHY|nr:uncharacterized protein C8Q71DRAFT_728463 [Rhodofomes roseus]KAH9828799.1 hypothetical protein C8Q71DRAFT_728463 [Rhodofomes roseus]